MGVVRVGVHTHFLHASVEKRKLTCHKKTLASAVATRFAKVNGHEIGVSCDVFLINQFCSC